MNNSTALIGVVKDGQLGLKGRSIQHMKLPLLQKGKQPPTALFVPVINFTIFNLNETGWEVGKKVGILINGEGTDPGTLLHFQLIMITHESSSYQVFHSFHEEIQSEFPISVTTKNLFLSLAYVCGGINMGDNWPWEVKELNPQEPFKEGQFSTPVGDLICLGQKFYNDTTQET
jgi:hypothetical protein